MTDTKKKDFISRIAIASVKKKLTGLKDKTVRERIKVIYKIIYDLNPELLAHISKDLLNFEQELKALKAANREIGGSDSDLMFDRAAYYFVNSYNTI